MVRHRAAVQEVATSNNHFIYSPPTNPPPRMHVFTPVCHSVHEGGLPEPPAPCPRQRPPDRDPSGLTSSGQPSIRTVRIILECKLAETIFTTHKQSLTRLCFHRYLSVHRGVCIQGGFCIQGGLHPGGICIQGGLHSRGICIWRWSLCIQGRGCASKGGLHLGRGDLQPGGRGSASRWLDRYPPDTTGYRQQLGSTHPTGMHSCLSLNLVILAKVIQEKSPNTNDRMLQCYFLNCSVVFLWKY